MKKIFIAAVTAVCAINMVFSQDAEEFKLSISGEARTGFYAWSREKDILNDTIDINVRNNEELPDEGADIHYNAWDNGRQFQRLDQSRGTDQGLYRINFHVEKGNIGAKFRFQMTDFTTGTVSWAYAFLYGSFFDNQFRVSAGKLGESPWGTGDEDLDNANYRGEDKGRPLTELDSYLGIRFEYMPSFVPGLNAGLVLNDWNSSTDIAIGTDKETLDLKELLSETVIGVSYTHDYFHARFAYRFDSELDNTGTGTTAANRARYRDQGGRIAYRVEERIFDTYLQGLQIWNTGYFEEVGNKAANKLTGANYLYAQYDPENFTARLRLGYNVEDIRLYTNGRGANMSRKWFSFQPSFYYKFFNNFLNAGLAFEFSKDFGDGLVSPDSYLSWYIEPQVRVNISRNFYMALVYRYHDEFYQMDIQTENGYSEENPGPFNSRTNWVNLRAVFTF